MTPELEKRARDLALILYGMYTPEGKDHPRGVTPILQALISFAQSEAEAAVMAERTRCADIADKQMEIYGTYGKMGEFDVAQIIRNLILMPSILNPATEKAE